MADKNLILDGPNNISEHLSNHFHNPYCLSPISFLANVYNFPNAFPVLP